MKILFVLRSGAGCITWEVPAEQRDAFSFVGMARGVRCDGFFQSTDLHIVYDEIASMLLNIDGTGPQMARPVGEVLN